MSIHDRAILAEQDRITNMVREQDKLKREIDGMDMVIYALVTRDLQPTFKEAKDEQQ